MSGSLRGFLVAKLAIFFAAALLLAPLPAPAASINVSSVIRRAFDADFNPTPLADLSTLPGQPLTFQVDFFVEVSDLQVGEHGFGNVAFDIVLDGLSRSEMAPGWMPASTYIDTNGSLFGGVFPTWAESQDYGPSGFDLRDIVIGTAPREFRGMDDPRRMLGQNGPELMGSLLVMWDGVSSASLEVNVKQFSTYYDPADPSGGEKPDGILRDNLVSAALVVNDGQRMGSGIRFEPPGEGEASPFESYEVEGPPVYVPPPQPPAPPSDPAPEEPQPPVVVDPPQDDPPADEPWMDPFEDPNYADGPIDPPPGGQPPIVGDPPSVDPPVMPEVPPASPPGTITPDVELPPVVVPDAPDTPQPPVGEDPPGGWTESPPATVPDDSPELPTVVDEPSQPPIDEPPGVPDWPGDDPPVVDPPVVDPIVPDSGADPIDLPTDPGPPPSDPGELPWEPIDVPGDADPADPPGLPPQLDPPGWNDVPLEINPIDPPPADFDPPDFSPPQPPPGEPPIDQQPNEPAWPSDDLPAVVDPPAVDPTLPDPVADPVDTPPGPAEPPVDDGPRTQPYEEGTTVLKFLLGDETDFCVGDARWMVIHPSVGGVWELDRTAANVDVVERGIVIEPDGSVFTEEMAFESRYHCGALVEIDPIMFATTNGIQFDSPDGIGRIVRAMQLHGEEAQTPEPETWLLILIGAVGLLFWPCGARRRGRQCP